MTRMLSTGGKYGSGKRVMNEGFSCAFHLISSPPFVAGLGIAIALVMTAIGYILSIASKGAIERKRLEMMGSDQKK
jgi:hypothetical protein